ncbi:hypothetical protein [Rhizorhabdus dicambivorans]|uniref:Uncharacterized protein n=1 Tax=Rhizorhabdus dicambivorans TaxID=1850238 RepID=A0A2A4G1J3_9SPHN|nr:hypothetical protein [Rhizorhabdus dicambivorans]ATE66627.1 hypothetical protein CMV14_21240 [Rhizorhabdus dicambivorans]PCE43889.1 hypothetical protein COO09_02910 [Rhizorhabdus dicambivorans]
MQRFLLPVLIVLSATPAFAVSEQPRMPSERAASVDRLFPELEIEGDGWRGLLPIMLMNRDARLQPRSAGTEPRQTPPQQ